MLLSVYSNLLLLLNVLSHTFAYQGVRNIHYSENLACFVFLSPSFWDLHFCHITDKIIIEAELDIKNITRHQLLRVNNADKLVLISINSLSSKISKDPLNSDFFVRILSWKSFDFFTKSFITVNRPFLLGTQTFKDLQTKSSKYFNVAFRSIMPTFLEISNLFLVLRASFLGHLQGINAVTCLFSIPKFIVTCHNVKIWKVIKLKRKQTREQRTQSIHSSVFKASK